MRCVCFKADSVCGTSQSDGGDTHRNSYQYFNDIREFFCVTVASLSSHETCILHQISKIHPSSNIEQQVANVKS
jgi:hypothetical protein